MIAAGYHTISSCQWLSQLTLQTGQAPLQVGPMFRRDWSGCVLVESPARRGDVLDAVQQRIRTTENNDSSFGWFDLGFCRGSFVFGS